MLGCYVSVKFVISSAGFSGSVSVLGRSAGLLIASYASTTSCSIGVRP